MRTWARVLATGVVLAAASAAQATLIPITNPGFELAGDGSPLGNWVLPYFDNVQGWASAWFDQPGNYENWGGQNTTTDSPYSKDGSHAMTFGSNNWSSLSQTPAVNNITIAAGTYALGMDIRSEGNGLGGYSAGFDWGWYNDPYTITVINSDNFTSASETGWSTVVATTLTVPEGSPLIGQRLGFYIQGFSIAANGDHIVPGNWPAASIDNVTLDFVAVPEPMSMGVFAGAGLVMLGRRRSRK